MLCKLIIKKWILQISFVKSSWFHFSNTHFCLFVFRFSWKFVFWEIHKLETCYKLWTSLIIFWNSFFLWVTWLAKYFDIWDQTYCSTVNNLKKKLPLYTVFNLILQRRHTFCKTIFDGVQLYFFSNVNASQSPSIIVTIRPCALLS